MARWNGGARGGQGRGRSKPHPARGNTADFGYAGLGPAGLPEPPLPGAQPPAAALPGTTSPVVAFPGTPPPTSVVDDHVVLSTGTVEESGLGQTVTVQGSTTTTGLRPAYPSPHPETADASLLGAQAAASKGRSDGRPAYPNASYSLELLAHFQCADVVCGGRWSLADPQGRLLKEGATLHSKAWYCPWCGLVQSATSGVA